jgi:hypothetical protein
LTVLPKDTESIEGVVPQIQLHSEKNYGLTPLKNLDWNQMNFVCVLVTLSLKSMETKFDYHLLTGFEKCF